MSRGFWMTKPVKIEFDCYDDAMTELQHAKSTLEVLSEVVHPHGRHLSDTVYAIQLMVERGVSQLEFGRFRGE